MANIEMNAAQGAAMRGVTTPGYALDPIDQGGGVYILPDRVLSDPKHAERHTQLQFWHDNNTGVSTAQSDWVSLSFGAMIHFGIRTFTQTNSGTEDVDSFAPTALDVGQWLDAIQAAGMAYVTLYVKHHSGLCIWPSQQTAYTIENSTWYVNQATSDIAKLFVDGCVARGIKPCFAFSMYDLNWEAAHPGYTDQQYTDFVKAQLTELLAYGDITAIWFDGWWWQFDSYDSPFDFYEIYNYIKSIQGDCLLVENNHLRTLANSDIVTVESKATGYVLEGNTLPADYLDTILVWDGNNYWTHWNYYSGVTYLDAASIESRITTYNGRNATYTLNLAPDTTGQLPAGQVAILETVGGP